MYVRMCGLVKERDLLSINNRLSDLRNTGVLWFSQRLVGPALLRLDSPAGTFH
jgi:hypothetical protein